MIKIAFLLYDFWMGGICTSYINLCSELNRQFPDKYEFIFIASDCKDFHPEIKKLGKCVYTKRLTHSLSELKPDIAQIACKPEYLTACKNAGIEKIVERVDGERSAFRIDKDLVSAYVCHSKGIFDKLERTYTRFDKPKNPLEYAYLIHNGVPIPKVKKIHRDKKSLVFGRMTRLGKGKNCEAMIRAAKEFPQHKFVIVGSNSRLKGSEKEYERLSEIVLEDNLLNVSLIPEIQDPKEIERIMLTFDVAVCTSLPQNEGMSNFLIQAISYGIPILTSNVGDHVEFFEHHTLKPGWIIYDVPCTSHDYIRSMENFEFRKQAGRDARQLIKNQWNVENTAKQYNSLYDRLMLSRALECNDHYIRR